MPKISEDERDERADQADRALGLEAVQPGPNSFAMKEVQRHRYMVQANAFYQQDWLARQNAPISDTPHPAFRQPDLISNLARPIPRLEPTLQTSQPPPPSTLQAQAHPHPRDSAITTMSPFVNADKGKKSPALNLGTTPDNTPRPTQRAFIEEHAGRERHQQSGTTDSRIPVFRPTLTMANNGFEPAALPSATNAANAMSSATMTAAAAMPAAMPAATTSSAATSSTTPTEANRPGTAEKSKGVTFAPDADKSQTAKTPKKSSFLSRFHLPIRRLQTPVQDRAPTPPPASQPPPSHVPVKAQQKLFSPKLGLARSPSKAKSFFSRRTSEGASALPTVRETQREDPHPRDIPRSQSSMASYGDTRAPGKRNASLKGDSDTGSDHTSKATPQPLARHQSLKWIDGTVPPTPPSKDTPPDEKVVRNQLSKQSSPIMPFQNETPTRTTGFASSDPRRSPSRSGSYGQRSMPRIQTAPSMQSMRASQYMSVVPNQMDPDDFNDAKNRIDGLGIAGFDTPAETHRRPASSVYSPDISSEQWGGGRNSIAGAIPARIEEQEEETNTPSPQPMSMSRHSRSLSTLTHGTTATSGTIPIGLAREFEQDDSMRKFMDPNDNTPPRAKQSSPAMSTAFEEAEEAWQNTAAPTTDPAQEDQLQNDDIEGGDSDATETPSSPHQRIMVTEEEARKHGELKYWRPVTPPEDEKSKHPAFRSKPYFEWVGPADHPSAPTFQQSQQPTAQPAPQVHHPSAQPSPLQVTQRGSSLEYLKPTVYQPGEKAAKWDLTIPKFQKKDEASKEKFQAAEEGTPVPKRQARDVMQNRPMFAAGGGATAIGTQGSRLPVARQHVNVDPQKSPKRPYERVASPSYAQQMSDPQKSPKRPFERTVSPSYGQQTSYGNQQQKRLVEGSSFDPTHDNIVDNAMRTMNERNDSMRQGIGEIQRTKAAIDRMLPAEKPTSEGDTAQDSAVGIDDYKKTKSGKRGSGKEDRHKRISTSAAHQFYMGTPEQKDSGTPTTEASTIVQTPNLPHGFQRIGSGLVTSSAVAGFDNTGTRSISDNASSTVPSSNTPAPPANTPAAGTSSTSQAQEIQQLKAMMAAMNAQMQQLLLNQQSGNQQPGVQQGGGDQQGGTSASDADDEDEEEGGAWLNPG